MILLFLVVLTIRVSAQSSLQKFGLMPNANLKGNNKTLIFYLTGDGGMNSFSTKLVQNLASLNYKVVPIDSKKFFWEEKTPASIGEDFSQLIYRFLKQTKSTEFVLVGYSFGADASIFVAANLAPSLNSQFKGIILLSPSMATDLEVKVSDMIGFGDSNSGKYKTMPTAKKLDKPIFCLAGADEDNPFYNGLITSEKVSKKLIPGSHRYNNDVSLVVSTIASALTSF